MVILFLFRSLNIMTLKCFVILTKSQHSVYSAAFFYVKTWQGSGYIMKYSIMYIRIEALHARLWCCLFGAASQPFEEAFVLRLDQTFCLRENQFMICPSELKHGIIHSQTTVVVVVDWLVNPRDLSAI